jgi:hypothetical protein
MSKACGKCSGTDFTDGGKCRACQRKANEKYRLKHAGGGSTVTSKTKAKESKPVEISAPAPAEVLEIQQGYGLRAHIDEPYLFVAQDDGEGKTDMVCLSRTELKQLIERFGRWAT